MKTAALLLASLITTLPAASFAQGMDMPGTESAPSAGGAPVAGPDAAPVAKPQKSGPYFGFSFGTGQGTLYGGGTSVDIDDFGLYAGESVTTLHLQFRSGFGTGDLLFGGQINFTRSFADVAGVPVGLDFMAFDLVATWWDQDMGLYARAGFGPAFFQYYVDDVTSDTFGGFEVMAGIGATMGGAGVGIDVFRQSYDEAETGFDSVSYVLVTLGLDMY